MSGIRGGGRPPPPPGEVGSKAPANEADTEVPFQVSDKGQTDNKQQKDTDRFEGTAPRVGPQLETKLQALAGKSQPKVQFTNKDMEQLATVFAAIIGEHPNVSRKKRARLFTKAILKRRRLRKLFSGMAETELEKMYDLIAEQIDSSPVFAELVDEVTEGARKLGA